MTRERDRVVSVLLSEAEWQAFIERHPQPVDWLREQILADLAGTATLPKPQPIVRQTPLAFSTRRV